MPAKPTPESRLIGSRIKEVRLRMALSQEAVAAELNYSRAVVSYVEHGRIRITQDLLLRYAVALGTTVGDLLSGTGVREGQLTPPCPACGGTGRSQAAL